MLTYLKKCLMSKISKEFELWNNDFLKKYLDH